MSPDAPRRRWRALLALAAGVCLAVAPPPGGPPPPPDPGPAAVGPRAGVVSVSAGAPAARFAWSAPEPSVRGTAERHPVRLAAPLDRAAPPVVLAPAAADARVAAAPAPWRARRPPHYATAPPLSSRT